MNRYRSRPWTAGALLLAVLSGGCAQWPGPALQNDERAVGAPLPYEAPLTELKRAPLLPAVVPEVVRSGSRRKKKIALTFDACSTQGPSKFDEGVIRALITAQAPATLFLGGNWMEEHPDETIELARYPQFELANHSYLHPHLTREPDTRVDEEITRTQDMLYTLTGQTARLFRAPYGEIDARVAQRVGGHGLISIQYDLASGDPDPRISAKRLYEYVRDQSRNGSIVVLHMNGRGWRTAEALPRIVHRLRKEGYKFVTVSQMLGLPPVPAAPGLSTR